jgi:hypothetical protein
MTANRSGHKREYLLTIIKQDDKIRLDQMIKEREMKVTAKDAEIIRKARRA